MKTLLFKCLAVVLLVAAQGFGVSVWAQEYSEQIKARLIAHPESSTAIELEGGRTIIYRKLIELSANERKDIRKLAIDRNAWLNFQEWEMAAIEASNVELDKRLAAIKASNVEADKRLAAIKASNVELDKRLAAIFANGVPPVEELVTNLRTVTIAGKKLPSDFYNKIERIVSIQKGYLDAGLKKESMEYLEFLLKRPELFEK
jgi:hypothetical protein